MSESKMTAEVERVHRHFVEVDALMSRRDLGKLDPERRLVQRLLLDELAHYRRRRRFPQNREFRGKMVPCFIDEFGTRCAVAHLLEVSGFGEVALDIARERPYARVPELAKEEGLRGWLDAAGFTVEEAARIQPSYCFITLAAVCFCNTGIAPTIAEGVTVGPQPKPDPWASYVTDVRIERIEGAPTAIKVGDIVQANLVDPGPDGLVLLRVTQPSKGGPPDVWQAGPALDPGGSTSTCTQNEFSRANPVPVDVLFQAFQGNSLDATNCENRLAELNSRWKGSQCDPESNDGGCAINGDRNASPLSVVSTASVLAAVLRYRRRRRAAS